VFFCQHVTVRKLYQASAVVASLAVVRTEDKRGHFMEPLLTEALESFKGRKLGEAAMPAGSSFQGREGKLFFFQGRIAFPRITAANVSVRADSVERAGKRRKALNAIVNSGKKGRNS
jgi:hypothetical protein